MKRLGRWVVVGLVTVGGTALAQGQQGQQGQQQRQPGQMGQQQRQPGQQQGQMGQPGQQQAKVDEQRVLNQLHSINDLEVKMAELVQNKNVSPAVKQYAQQMVRDHTAANKQLQQFAQRKGMQLQQFEPQTDAQRQRMELKRTTMQLLEQLDGPELESMYLASQVGAHDHAIMTTQEAIQGLGRSELTQVLTSLVPALQQHRTMAYQQLGQQRPPMRQGRQPTGR